MSRERIVQLGLAGVLGAFVIGALLLTVIGGSDSSAPEPGAFGQHYGGLEQRRLEADVPTMAEGGGSHFHPLLSVYANDKRVTVPANIGIDPTNPPTEMAGLHTHDETGTIHNEAGSGATLGDFFAVWGVPLSAEHLGPYRAGGAKTVRVWSTASRLAALGGWCSRTASGSSWPTGRRARSPTAFPARSALPTPRRVRSLLRCQARVPIGRTSHARRHVGNALSRSRRSRPRNLV